MPLDLNVLLQNKHPDKLILSAPALLKNSQYYGVSLEDKRAFFNQLFGCSKANFDLEVLNKKTYMLKMTLPASNLATNATVVFKLNHRYNLD